MKIQISPIPQSDSRREWHRRFTELVSQFLAYGDGGEDVLRPNDAGLLAKDRIRQEWSSTFPAVEVPSWMP